MSFTKFREHRGSLDDSMKTVVPCFTYDGLLKYVRGMLYQWYVEVPSLQVEHYHYDERIGWDNWIVTLKGYGVVGFTDGPVDDIPEQA